MNKDNDEDEEIDIAFLILSEAERLADIAMEQKDLVAAYQALAHFDAYAHIRALSWEADEEEAYVKVRESFLDVIQQIQSEASQDPMDEVFNLPDHMWLKD